MSISKKPKWHYRKNKDGFMGSENRIMETIKIEVNAGVVTDVKNLPEGYDYEIVDHDLEEPEDDGAVKADKPLAGNVYALTGGPGTKCIANGNTWADSLVKDDS